MDHNQIIKEQDDQLNEIASLTNGKVFDGKSDLVTAFKKVRGYN